MNLNEEICGVKWTAQDLADAMSSVGIEPTETALNAVIKAVRGALENHVVERGWEVIDAAIAAKPWL
jgi:ribosomal protein L12E/L44/L45/RPP1/RPP2